MRVLDGNSESLVRPSAFLHGLTGGGKSTWSTKGGRPMVILLEPKAISVLRQINPQAVGLVPESMEDLDNLMVRLGQPEWLQKMGIDRIVLDSYTGLTEVLPSWIRARQQTPGVLAKAFEIQEYGHLGDYATAIVKAIQLTGYPSVIIGRSISKRVGLSERIQPDSVGKSVNSLPGKLLPTAEARYDAELGYVIDTTPCDWSQRCGLPWVPAIVRADDVSCLDYLRIIEAGNQENTLTTTAPATAPQASASPESPVGTGATAPGAPSAAQHVARGAKAPKKQPADPTPGSPAKPSEAQSEPGTSNEPAAPSLPTEPDPAWVRSLVSYAACIVHLPEADRKTAVAEWERQYAEDPAAAIQALQQYLALDGQVREAGIDPEKDPKGYQAAFGKMCLEIQAEKIGAGKAQQHSAEVEDFVEGVSPECAAPEDVAALLDLAREHKVNLDALWKYALSRDSAKACPDGAKNWNSLAKKFVIAVKPHMEDAAKRRVFIPSIHQKFA